MKTTESINENALAEYVEIYTDPKHPEFDPVFCLELAHTCFEVGCDLPPELNQTVINLLREAR